jgi:hypothetical protein
LNNANKQHDERGYKMTLRELDSMKRFLNINSREKAQEFLDIFALDCREFHKRHLISKILETSDIPDELYYLIPDGDNINQLTFAIYLDNEFFNKKKNHITNRLT